MEAIAERYKLLEKIGEGGMGVVYAAHDTHLHRTVAVKTLAEDLYANKEALHIFKEEAKILAQIRHPNLLTIHDVIQQPRRTSIVMEYIKGQTLAHILEAHPNGLEPMAALNLWMQLLAALAYLHRKNIIHRDIKPGNLMIDEDGIVRLMDFGLARSLEAIRQRSTRIRGTPAYMAPEHIMGRELSCSSDLYSSAVAMYEAFCGRIPFDGNDIAFQHVHNDPPHIRSIRSDIPEPIAQALHDCLKKDPRQRPPHAVALLQRLDRALPWAREGLPPSVLAELQHSPVRGSGLLSHLTHTPRETPIPSPIQTPPPAPSAHKADEPPRPVQTTPTPPVRRPHSSALPAVETAPPSEAAPKPEPKARAARAPKPTATAQPPAAQPVVEDRGGLRQVFLGAAVMVLLGSLCVGAALALRQDPSPTAPPSPEATAPQAGLSPQAAPPQTEPSPQAPPSQAAQPPSEVAAPPAGEEMVFEKDEASSPR